ncbi:MAG: hypothetical protein JRJ37_06220, partial [Deltaproteobacteria bacterium]|nr:hypothetical protein [Deltaproteobacteria bacterium]
MAFTNFGVAKAAAHRINFEGMVQGMVQQEQLTNAAIQQKKTEVQYYAEKQKRGTSDIPYVQQRLDVMNKEIVHEIGEFQNNNPGWKMDIDKTAEYNAITGKFLNNEWIQNGETAKANYEAFQQANNAGKLTDSEFLEYSKAWEEYSTPGVEHKEPFSFSMPERINSAQLTGYGLKMFQPSQRTIVRNRVTGVETYSDPDEALKVGRIMYNDPSLRASIDALYKGQEGLYDNPAQMMSDLLMSGQKTAISMGRAVPGAGTRTQAQIDALIKSQAEDQYYNQVAASLDANNRTAVIPQIGALTDLGEKGSIVDFSDPTLMMSVRIPGTGAEPDTYEPINLAGRGKVTGGGRAFRHNGMDYAEVQIEFDVDPSEYASDPDNPDAAASPLDYFESVKMQKTADRQPAYSTGR